MNNSISGFNYYKTKPAKTFGSMSVSDDEYIDICEHCGLNDEICFCNEELENEQD